MSASQISTSVTIINSLLGFQAISLTEFDTSAESSIAAGSKVEIASAFFTFATDESISGFSSITTGETCYIALTPAGTAGSQTVSAAWVSAAPVWDDAKQGWYTTTSSSIRVVGGAYKNLTGGCEDAFLLEPKQTIVHQNLETDIIEIGAWDMTTTSTVSVVANINTRLVKGAHLTISADAGIELYHGGPAIFVAGTMEVGLGGSELVYGGQDVAVETNNVMTITRRTGGHFDSASFNDATVNRGFLTLHYAPPETARSV